MRGRRGALAAGLSVLAMPVLGRGVSAVDRSYLVFFDFDSAEVTALGAQIIADAARHAFAMPSESVQIVGNADKAGSTAYNLELSRRRAYAVAGMLRMNGWPPDRTEVLWFGENRFISATADGVAEAQNRYVVLIHR